MNSENTVKVSVCCGTFNHKPYLRECLESLLMQKTSFEYEILLHDDASTDGTTEIVKEYAAKYPERIRPVIQTVNQYSSNTRAIITTFLLPLARGEYISLCEGDDYWTDPFKLQKQVDVMENDPDISLCLHPAVSLKPNGRKKIRSLYAKSQPACITDIIRWKQLFWPTASLLYRKEMMTDYPDFCLKCHIGDAPLVHYMAIRGKVYYLNEAMSVYRKNVPGSHSDRCRNISDPDRQEICRTEFEMLDGFNRLTKYIYNFHFIKRKLYVQSCILSRRRNYFRIKVYDGFYADLKQMPAKERLRLWKKIYLSPLFKRHIYKTNT
jgi:glycosyltransferase involved in cell wall biosynthesis